MAFFKFLFYALFFILISVGDVVYSSVAKGSVFLSSFFRKSKFLKSFKDSKKVKNSKTQRNGLITIRLYIVRKASYIRKWSSSIFKMLCILILALLHIVLGFIKSLFFPFFLIRKINFRIHHKKRGRPHGPIKTPFFYRLKYLFIGAIFAFFFLFLPLVFFIFLSDLPKLSDISVNYLSKTTKIFDRNGELLFEIYGNQNRTIVTLDKIPTTLKNATIAIEDRDFYNHNGFDLRGIIRALYVDLTKKGLQGGSTITQQLIKSALLTPEVSVDRKIREIVLAFLAEQKYTKDEILELYFNYVPYGGTAWGVEAASRLYFGKSVANLSLSESAYLAGLPQAPTQYSPYYQDGSLGKKRQKDVLKAMVSEGYITQKEADEAFGTKLQFKPPHVPIRAPHFVMYVKEYLIRKYGLPAVERGGLHVVTTLDMSIQEEVEAVVREEVEKNGYLGVGNGAGLVTNPQNGDIIAMVGSRDYFDSESDGNVNITTSLRQPGSTIKIVTYALALSEGLTEASILEDRPLTITYPNAPSYTPVNYDGKFHGRVPLRLAFANSFNIPAVRLVQRFGVEKVVDLGKKMGISSWKSPENYGVSITLGAAEVSMAELATIYGVVANGGKRIDLDPVLQITDSGGKEIYKKEPKPQQVIDEGVAFILSDILSDSKARSIAFGYNTPLNLQAKKVAVKTGTTDNKRDNWTVGYTPELLVVTWVGNNDNTPLSPTLTSGITGAAPMWNRIMTNLLERKKTSEFIKPDNVIQKDCYGYTAYFLRGSENVTCKLLIPSPTLQQQ